MDISLIGILALGGVATFAFGFVIGRLAQSMKENKDRNGRK